MVKKSEIIRDILLVIFLILLIILFGNFILENKKIIIISFLFFFINYIIIMLHENKYGKNNFPYKPYKSKKKIGGRIFLGLLAGIHYLFFIGSYNHKKYNTQVHYPETFECFFGNISQLIMLVAYIFIAVELSKINLYISLIFISIPIITNIISLKKRLK